jgi:DNA-binding CsgD family transcriptional regulator
MQLNPFEQPRTLSSRTQRDTGNWDDSRDQVHKQVRIREKCANINLMVRLNTSGPDPHAIADVPAPETGRRARPPIPARSGIVRLRVLVGLVLLQLLGAVYFLGDVIVDLATTGPEPHFIHEALATAALFAGVAFGAIEGWRSLHYRRRSDAALKMAAGAFGELLRDRFGAWGLTDSERQVAMLTLKGFDGPDIARMRGTAPGTVRAQLGNIYAKSGSSSRGQFVSLFIDDLLDEPVIQGPV